jgi:hypothetical protein
MIIHTCYVIQVRAASRPAARWVDYRTLEEGGSYAEAAELIKELRGWTAHYTMRLTRRTTEVLDA